MPKYTYWAVLCPQQHPSALLEVSTGGWGMLQGPGDLQIPWGSQAICGKCGTQFELKKSDLLQIQSDEAMTIVHPSARQQ